MRPFALLLATSLWAGAASVAVPATAAQSAGQSSAQSERPVPPLVLTGRVVDQAEVITPQSEAAMTELLARLERDLGVQFVVVSTASLNGMPIEQYSLALGNGWALGNAERNDGLLLVVAPNERRARIEVGKGLEPILTDAFCRAIIDLMLPSFREGNYADGMMIGVVSLDTRLRKVAAEQAG